MKFYSSIHEYYDHIFPLNLGQVKLVENTLEKGSSILDIGCATGNLAIALNQNGFKVEAFDLDTEMVTDAIQKNNSTSLNFKVGNMLNIKKDYSLSQFNSVLCFGNTLVHLDNEEEVEQFFSAVYTVLKGGGKFLFQLLNYEYILRDKIFELPLIDNETIRFKRSYSILENKKLNFETILSIKKTNELIKNQVELLPITKNQIENLLAEVGFISVSVFSSFAKAKFDNNSLPLIVSAVKP